MEEQEKLVDGGVRSHFAGGRRMREQRSVEKRGRGAGKSTLKAELKISFFYFILKWSLELCRIRWKINFNLKK